MLLITLVLHFFSTVTNVKNTDTLHQECEAISETMPN